MLLRTCVAWAWVLVAAFSGRESAAGVSAKTLTSCEEEIVRKPEEKFATFTFIDKGGLNTSVPSYIVRDTYSTGGIVDCASDTRLEFVNEPDGPPKGTTLNAGDLAPADVQKLLSNFEKFLVGAANISQVHTGIVLCPPTQCGAIEPGRATPAIALPENSRGSFAIFQTVAGNRTRIAGRIAIPFLVISKGDDDWLEISNRGKVFWKMSLKDLTLRQLYFADVPSQAFDTNGDVWAIFLNGDGPEDAVVFVPNFGSFY